MNSKKKGRVYNLTIMGKVDRLGRPYLGHTIQASRQFQTLWNFQCPPQELVYAVVRAALQFREESEWILIYRTDLQWNSARYLQLQADYQIFVVYRCQQLFVERLLLKGQLHPLKTWRLSM